jgi:hypothetical protein
MSSPWNKVVRLEGTWLLHEAPDWSRYASPNWLDTILTVDVPDRFHAKQGRSIGRWTLTNGTEKLVVYLKRHFELPWWDRTKAKLIPHHAHSPGLQEWQHLVWAESVGIRVPRTVAVGELRRTDGQLLSFIALEELAGMLALHEAIPLAEQHLNSVDFSTWKAGLFREMARLSWELHRRGYFHQDLYLCHFYVLESDCRSVPTSWTNRVVMIDFHRLTHSWFLPITKRWKDLSQLLYSTYGVSGLGDSDREQIWQAYQEVAQDQALLKQSLFRAVSYKSQRYYRHNLKANG